MKFTNKTIIYTGGYDDHGGSAGSQAAGYAGRLRLRLLSTGYADSSVLCMAAARRAGTPRLLRSDQPRFLHLFEHLEHMDDVVGVAWRAVLFADS